MHEDESKFLVADSDIAVQERPEWQLQLTAEKYQAILEELDVAIIVTDDQGRLTSWNTFTQRLLGMSCEELNCKPVQSLYPPEEWEKIKTRDLRENGIPYYFKTKLTRNDGKKLDVELMLSTLKNADGQVTGSMGVFKEFTSNELLKEAIKEASRIKSEFVSVVSHELRTPLTSIKAGIDIILDGFTGKINEEQKDILDVTRRSIETLHRLINDLLDVEKLESGKMKFNIDQVDVNEVVRDVHQLMLPSVKSSGIDFSLQLADNLPKINLDRDKMAQVLTNLVGNSMKFTEKGSITITTERKGNIVQVSVSDTGCGISEEDLPRAFYKFEQLQQNRQNCKGGTGLGLSISKEIIEQHRGKIYGESEEGKGTTFHIILPIIERRRARRKEID